MLSLATIADAVLAEVAVVAELGMLVSPEPTAVMTPVAELRLHFVALLVSLPVSPVPVISTPAQSPALVATNDEPLATVCEPVNVFPPERLALPATELVSDATEAERLASAADNAANADAIAPTGV